MTAKLQPCQRRVVKLHPVTKLILLAALIWLTSEIVVVAGVIRIATDPSWLRLVAHGNADWGLRKLARGFADIAGALGVIGTAIWLEGLSRWAETLKVKRLANLATVFHGEGR